MTFSTRKLDFDDILQKYVPAEQLKRIKLDIYGRSNDNEIELSKDALDLAIKNNFQIKGFAFPCDNNAPQGRKPRIVRIAGIQTGIVRPTTDPVHCQLKAIHDRVLKIIEAAAISNVNILCLQELWMMPFGLCTGESKWCEFAEDAEHGPSTSFLSKLARQHNMVIISPILERDTKRNEVIWNTAVVISNTGHYIGKHRKNHIPVSYECKYYCPGNIGHPVFETDFGRIAINICFGRQHVLNWMMFGLNGAEIVFNPTGTTMPISGLWTIQARNAACANGYYTLAVNRIGTEWFSSEFTTGKSPIARHEFGQFYGSSYIAGPDGTRSPSLSSTMDGLLIGDVDLSVCMEFREKLGWSDVDRLSWYAEKLTSVTRFDFEPELVRL